ncbi:MAG TPA: SDR family oxidoreductase [Thermoanaerobaculia bacterium]|nr:SDR family oxidoreductase [Thermoanaerobaculia bacterium]
MPDARIAVVTGGNRGIGFEVCRQLAGQGLRVVLTARDEEKARRAAGEIPGAVPFVLDVTDPVSPGKLSTFLEESGGVDVLVNNAGVFIDQDYGGVDIPMEIVQETLAVNVLGPWQISQAVIPFMKRRGYGRIVNVSSGLGAMSEMAGGYPAYRVSKLAVNGLTRILADELRGTGILVNTVCPGWVQTDMGGPNAPVPVEKGADTIVWLATLPDGGPTGHFFRERRQIPW